MLLDLLGLADPMADRGPYNPMSKATMNRQTRELVAELMRTADKFHADRGSRVQDRGDLEQRLGAALSRPNADAFALADDVDRVRTMLRSADPARHDMGSILLMGEAEALLMGVAPFLRGSDFSDRPAPARTLRQRIAGWFRRG